MTHSDVTPRPPQPPDRSPPGTAAPSWIHLADLPEVIERTFHISAISATALLRAGIKRGMAHVPREPGAPPRIPHRIEVVQPRSLTPRCDWQIMPGRPIALLSARVSLSIADLGGVDAIKWVTGTIRGYPIEVESTAVLRTVAWYFMGWESNIPSPQLLLAPLAAQPVARRRDPPRRDFRKADALLYPEIDAMLAEEPKLSATGAAKRLIVARQLVGKNVEPESVLRRLVKGYLASRPEMRRRSG